MSESSRIDSSSLGLGPREAARRVNEERARLSDEKKKPSKSELKAARLQEEREAARAKVLLRFPQGIFTEELINAYMATGDFTRTYLQHINLKRISNFRKRNLTPMYVGLPTQEEIDRESTCRV